MTTSQHIKKKAIDYYLERTELTHRMRMRAAWVAWCEKHGSNPNQISGNFRKLAKQENWAARWKSEARPTKDELVKTIHLDFARVLTDQTRIEVLANDSKLTLHGIIANHLVDYHIEHDDDGNQLEKAELEKKRKWILKRVDMIATIIKKLATDKTYYERATMLFEEA